MNEQWRAIPGHEGRYEASNLGRIRSVDRIVAWKTRWGTIGHRSHLGRVIHPDPHHTGYLQIKLGSQKIYRVHKLIAITWLGPIPDGMIVSHSDDNKQNNAASNLEYMTNSDNVKRSYRTGRLSNCGERNGKAVLTDGLVQEILGMPSSMSCLEVANVVGCKKHNVVQVRSGRCWKHIPRPALT